MSEEPVKSIVARSSVSRGVSVALESAWGGVMGSPGPREPLSLRRTRRRHSEGKPDHEQRGCEHASSDRDGKQFERPRRWSQAGRAERAGIVQASADENRCHENQGICGDGGTYGEAEAARSRGGGGTWRRDGGDDGRRRDALWVEGRLLGTGLSAAGGADDGRRLPRRASIGLWTAGIDIRAPRGVCGLTASSTTSLATTGSRAEASASRTSQRRGSTTVS